VPVRLAPRDDLAISIPVQLTHAQNFHALAATYSILIQSYENAAIRIGNS